MGNSSKYQPRHGRRHAKPNRWLPPGFLPAAGAVLGVALLSVGLLNYHYKSRGQAADSNIAASETGVETTWAVQPCPDGAVPSRPEDWESTFASMPSWRGGDQGSSVQLSDGRVLWLFNDTVAERSSDPVLLRNSVILTRGSCVELDSSSQTEFFPSTPQSWWWPTHAAADGQTAWVLAGEFEGGSDSWDFTHVSSALYRLDVQSDSVRVRGKVQVPNTGNINWSAGLARIDKYLVLFGVDSYLRLYTARTPLLDPGSQWEYTNGSGGWTPEGPQAAPGPYVGATSVSAEYTGDGWSIISKPGGLVGEELVEFTSASLHGPFQERAILHVPAVANGPWLYNPVRHPWAGAQTGTTLISLSQNVASIEDVYRNYGLYRPDFLTLPAGT